MVVGWVLMVLWRGKTPKLELGQAPFKVGWGRLTRGLDGGARDMMPQPEMTPPSRINLHGSVGHGGESRERTKARRDRPWQDASVAIRMSHASLLRTTHARHRSALPARLLCHKWQRDGACSRGGGKPSCAQRGDEHITAQYQQQRHRSKAVGTAEEQRLAARSTTR